MKRLKKAALAVACAAVLCSVFSGCGGDKKDTAKAAPAEEKVLTVYTARSESLNNLVIPAFEKETGIKVNVIVAGTGPLVKRVASEKDNPQGDILWAADQTMLDSQKELFEKYVSPEDANMIDAAKNKTGYFSPAFADPTVFIVNKKLAGDMKIAGFDDLLNPALKGKIVFADPQASSSSFEHLVNMLYAMGTDGQPNGWDYVKEFCKQLPNGCVNSSSAVYKGVADGEYTVGLTFEQGAATYVSQGNVKVVYMNEGVIIRGDGVYIVKDCPNVVSARAFLDWLTGYDAQVYMNETQFRRTIRKDVPETNAMQSMSSINVIKDDETVASEHKREWIEMFQEALVDAAE